LSSAATEHSSLSNSAARADTIRDAVRWIAEREAEAKAINAEIREYKAKHIRGDLGFKIADFNAIYRVSQLEAEDRDELLECVREGFAALGIGGSVDWVDAAERTPRGSNSTAPADEAARAAGRQDGLSGSHDHAAEYPQGEPGHGDYMLGLADGEAERERVIALGNGAGAPKRSRGRPRKQQQEAEADAEF
jgi:ribosomal protein L12E/L44/L45/RPP1/RPP2